MEVNRKELSEALKVCQANSKGVMAILTGVRVIAKENKLTLLATDLEVFRKVVIDCGDGELDCLVSWERLFKQANAMSGETINLSIDGNRLIIKCGRSNTKVPIMPVDDFPEFPKLAGDHKQANITNFGSMLAKMSIFANNDEPRQILRGVLAGDGEVVATNGKWLGMYKHGGGAINCVIPLRSCGIMSSFDGECVIKYDSRMASVACNESEFIVKIVEGIYPNYKQIVPADFASKVVLDAKALENTIKPVVSLGGANIELIVSEGQLKAFSRNEGHTAEATMPIEYNGETKTFMFSSEYINGFVRAFGGKEIVFDFNDEGTPAKLTAGDCSAIIMPMKKV